MPINVRFGEGGQEKANAAFACLNRHNLDVIPVTFIEYVHFNLVVGPMLNFKKIGLLLHRKHLL